MGSVETGTTAQTTKSTFYWTSQVITSIPNMVYYLENLKSNASLLRSWYARLEPLNNSSRNPKSLAHALHNPCYCGCGVYRPSKSRASSLKLLRTHHGFKEQLSLIHSTVDDNYVASGCCDAVGLNLDTAIMFPENQLLLRLFTPSLNHNYKELYQENGVKFKKGDFFLIMGGMRSVEFKVIETDPQDYCVIALYMEIVKEGEPLRREDEDQWNEIGYDHVGRLSKQMTQIREVVELPVRHTQIFKQMTPLCSFDLCT